MRLACADLGQNVFETDSLYQRFDAAVEAFCFVERIGVLKIGAWCEWIYPFCLQQQSQIRTADEWGTTGD